ncbi:MAG TPA: ATP-dependent DNA ligase [Methylomirabilota bacterium]|nr:ATP-dependent DNA ligase [Methylomirabilota bacterium]
MRRSAEPRAPARWPALSLPITPPYPPMEARLVDALPATEGWLFEPKWDGFRCLAYRDGETVALQSKAGQPLTRYFPEIVDALLRLPARRFLLDGELLVPADGGFSFDDLLQRLHPAASRIQRLAAETPALLLAFDLLVDESGGALVELPLTERRRRLETFAEKHLAAGGTVRLSPATADRAVAEAWLREPGALKLDGVIAKRAAAAYASGERTAMQKIKRMRTADCVVGGFRYAAGGRQVGSLLLGLYDGEGRLHHVGFTSSFSVAQRATLLPRLRPFLGGAGFTGHAPGGPSRWATERSGQWEPLKPALVCEVRYDHWSGDRFRHGTTFLRWRPDKAPLTVTFDSFRESSGERHAADQA